MWAPRFLLKAATVSYKERDMQHYASSENGFVETPSPHSDGWLNVCCPDETEMHILVDDFGMPPVFLDYIGDPDERPRVDREGDWSIIILRIPTRSNQKDVPYETVPIGVICHDDLIITLCYSENDVITDFVTFSRQRHLEITNRSNFILHIIYRSATWYLKYLQNINNDVSAAERNMASSVRNEELMRLTRLQKTLVYFNTSLHGNEMMLERLEHLFAGEYDPELLDDVDIEIKQAISTVAIYTEILESTMDALGSIISNNLNGVMKRMTALSISLMVPTLIASFYGMNVNVGFDGFPYAFPLIILISLCLTVGVLLWLKHIKWF